MPIRTEEAAREWRGKVRNAVADIPEAKAFEIASIYPQMDYSGALIPYKSRITFNGKLYQAKQDLWNLESNNPTNLPASWTLIRYRNGHRYINETMYADEAFSKDEIGYYEPTNKFYKSLIANNTWTPIAYAAGWQEVSI